MKNFLNFRGVLSGVNCLNNVNNLGQILTETAQ